MAPDSLSLLTLLSNFGKPQDICTTVKSRGSQANNTDRARLKAAQEIFTRYLAIAEPAKAKGIDTDKILPELLMQNAGRAGEILKTSVWNALNCGMEVDPQLQRFAELLNCISRKTLQRTMDRIQQDFNEPAEGFCYLIRAENGLCKLGLSKNPRKRFMQIKGSSPVPVELVHVIATNQMNRLEYELHETFKAQRKTAEWFALDENDILNIKTFETVTYVGLSNTKNEAAPGKREFSVVRTNQTTETRLS